MAVKNSVQSSILPSRPLLSSGRSGRANTPINFGLEVDQRVNLFQYNAVISKAVTTITDKTVGTPRVPSPQFNVKVVANESNVKNASTLN